jgi:hypothetical protein
MICCDSRLLSQSSKYLFHKPAINHSINKPSFNHSISKPSITHSINESAINHSIKNQNHSINQQYINQNCFSPVKTQLPEASRQDDLCIRPSISSSHSSSAAASPGRGDATAGVGAEGVCAAGVGARGDAGAEAGADAEAGAGARAATGAGAGWGAAGATLLNFLNSRNLLLPLTTTVASSLFLDLHNLLPICNHISVCIYFEQR